MGGFMADEIPLFPIAGWSIGPIPAHNAVVLKFDFLTHSMQALDHANESRHYLLTPQQAQIVAEKILSALRQLENGAPQSPLGPRH
jgi:biofilm regulator BssS